MEKKHIKNGSKWAISCGKVAITIVKSSTVAATELLMASRGGADGPTLHCEASWKLRNSLKWGFNMI